MKLIAALAASIILSAPLALAQTEEHPEWVRNFIAGKEAQPVENPPGSLTKCLYKDKIVYYYPPVCCDQYSELYDEAGNYLCAPDGGMTGDGDGKCSDFYDLKADCEVIWSDKRSS